MLKLICNTLLPFFFKNSHKSSAFNTNTFPDYEVRERI